jgi:RNase P/RNase MRP subunit p29
MNPKPQTVGVLHKLVMAGVVLLALAFTLNAQVKTTTKVEHGPATHAVTIERGEVVHVSGNNLVIKMENGEIRHFDNVPDTATVEVDGKQLTVHDLKPGMKLQRSTVTTTAPKTITTVRTVTGTVWNVVPPSSVTLTLADGTNKMFKIPKGQKFTVDGKETDAFALRKGMRVSATAVTEVPEIEVRHEVARTGKMPEPPAPIPADVPILIEEPAKAAPVASAAPAPAQAEPAPKKLPKTGSYLPLVGLLGALSTGLGLGLKAVRASRS